MRWQLRTLQTPGRGSSAFTPIPTSYPEAATNGQNVVTNTLGTVAIYSPRPAAMTDNSWGGMWQPSSVSPNFIKPAVGIVHLNRTMSFMGRLWGHRPSPVPAAAIGAVANQGVRSYRLGGRSVTATPRPFTQWPTYGSRGNG